jgi:hypothetical protein
MTSTGLTGVHKSTAIIRAAALLLCLTIVLIHPPSIITAAPSDAAAQAIVKLRAIEQSDMDSVGPVVVSIDSTSNKISLQATQPYLRASFRFPESAEADFKPGPTNTSPMLLNGSENVNIFEVSLLWCGWDAAGTSTCENAKPPDNYPITSCPEKEKDQSGTLSFARCTINVVYSRDLKGISTADLIPAFVLSKSGLLVSESILERSRKTNFPTFTINGVSLRQLFADYKTSSTKNPKAAKEQSYVVRSGWESVTDFHFEVYPASESCRPYLHEDEKDAIDAIRPLSDFQEELGGGKLTKDNGIKIEQPKVYDVYTLRQMLAQTASQLSALSGFNPASITAAFTNLQGVTSSTSFFNAQVTANPTPSIVSTVGNPNTGIVTTTPASGNSYTSTTATCPTGYLPTIGSGNAVTCTAATGSTSPVTIATTTTPAGNSTPSAGAQTVVTQNPLTQQTVTTTPSVTAAVPTAPASTAFAAPTNTGESASDLLIDQVQFNAQITSLQLALQGALSDQYLTRQGKATGTRQQTTLGFNISIDPHQRYKHAVAEVKIWVYQEQGGDNAIKVVNLLPAAKTYNVAKITSSQKAFGAGVAISVVNVGAAGGKSKNRLYLAKDTDTVALLYTADKRANPRKSWPYGATPVGRSPQEHVADVAREIEAWQSVGDACADDPGPALSLAHVEKPVNPLVFGWQFRPVLGASYVQGGQRQVFAQLALPAALGQQYSPLVFIQTRWREYDAKNQVVGAVYKGSCSIIRDTDPIQVINPLEVKKVAIDDMGSGVLKVTANGEFLSQGFSVMNGPAFISPTTFDGSRIEFFANATNLLMDDDLQLMDETGKTTPLALRPVLDDSDDPNACSIAGASFGATPRPDGNSRVEAKVTTGTRYRLQDKPPVPLFLIGTQVYGLHETPFLEPPSEACHDTVKDQQKGITCIYHFLASTDILRAAQNFTVRDLTWTQFKKSGTIQFDPSFTSLTLLATNQPPPPDNTAPDSKSAKSKPTPAAKATPKAATPALPPVYTLTGNDLYALKDLKPLNCAPGKSNCLDTYQGLSRFELTDQNFQVTSKTTAVVTFTPAGDNLALTPTPLISLANGSKTKASITDKDSMGNDTGAKIFYTINGTTPSTDLSESNYYEGAFPVTAKVTVKAIAISDKHFPSAVAIANVTPNPNDRTALHIVQIPTSTGTASQLAYKAYRFVWHPTKGEPIEWDLPVPQQTAPAVTASSILNQSDSTEVTFSNVQVLANSTTLPITFAFDGNLLTNPIFKYDPTAMTVKILITGNMTAKPGHKELLLNGYTMAPGTTTQTAVQIELPFDVTKR